VEEALASSHVSQYVLEEKNGGGNEKVFWSGTGFLEDQSSYSKFERTLSENLMPLLNLIRECMTLAR